ncbi:MAG TPA: DUF4910 domain-containing protein [Thermoanaerobaculia bacterium]
MSGDYTKGELVSALRAVGLCEGDVVFAHVGAAALGRPEGGEGEIAPDALLAAFGEVLGESGTLLVPTYTFSFCRGEDFDVAQTPTAGGPWSPSVAFLEFVRGRPGAVRSRDPIHSVAGIGSRAKEMLQSVAPTCFGAGSVFARLRAAGAKVCLIGLPLEEASFRHHVEESVGVPFRFRKLFTGRIRDAEGLRRAGWVYFVRILAENGQPDGARLEEITRRKGVCRSARVGKGEVLAFDAPAFFELTAAEISRDPWLTAKGPAGDPIALENARVSAPVFRAELPPDAPLSAILDALWRWPRDLVSDAFDGALAALSTQIPMTVHEYPSGTEAWSWIVPEKWTCHEAFLETLDGRRLFSYADNPLHVVSYSLPFEGEVSREELLRHLHVHPRIPEAVPYIFKYYERDWGLCCSRLQRDALKDERYRVVIRSSSRYATMKVGESIVGGRRTESVVLAAHLCHPAMVNDDMSGILVAVEVMRRLLRRPTPRYTYRLLIVPETIGSIAWLDANAALVPQLKGGLFLEMLGLPNPHALQRSFAGNTELDRAFERALSERDPAGWAGAFRTVIGNDERQFNGPGVRVPMLSLSRVLRPGHPDWPYLEYHSDHDVPGTLSFERIEESVNLVLAMIDALEAERIPVNVHKGELFCSRYGVHIDAYVNPEGNKKLFDMLDRIDGTRSMAQIAQECGTSLDAVQATVSELARLGVVEWRD